MGYRFSKGLSPLIASVLLVAFTMSVATVAGPWMSDLMQSSQEGQSERAGDILQASSASLSVEDVSKSGSSAEVTLRNSGTGSLTNYTVTVFCDEPVLATFSETLNGSEVVRKSVDGCSGNVSEVSVEANNIPVRTEVYDDDFSTATGSSTSSTSISWSKAHSYGPDCSNNNLEGDGNSSDPYLIKDDHDLQCIRKVNQKGSAYYKLTQNINATLTDNWDQTNYSAGSDMPSGEGFALIGSASVYPFSGHLNGSGYKVKGLYSHSSYYAGFIGQLGDGGSNQAVVKNIGLLDVHFNETGDTTHGGLAKSNYGKTVENVYVTGVVAQPSNYGYVGGLAGYNGEFINSSYSSTKVTGGSPIGGHIGYNGGTVNNSYWDINVSGQASSAGGVGLETDEMKGSAAKSNMTGFDFQNIWKTVEEPDDYPELR